MKTGFLCFPSATKSLEKDIDLKILEKFRYLSLPLESILEITKYKKSIQRLVTYLKQCHEQDLKPLVLDIRIATARNDHWSLIVDCFSKDPDLFSKIAYLNFFDSSLTLKQLQDCQLLFKKCHFKGIQFPILNIESSHAAIQIFMENALCKDNSSMLSDEELIKLSDQQVRELIGNLREPDKDISKEKFIQAISEDNFIYFSLMLFNRNLLFKFKTKKQQVSWKETSSIVTYFKALSLQSRRYNFCILYLISLKFN